MSNYYESSQALAVSITRAASQQTYYTIRLLADRQHIADAYRAYAYFRWMDDQLDLGTLAKPKRTEFLDRQRSLMEDCFQGKWPHHLTTEERMLVDLIRGDHEKNSGLQSYIRNMMDVMVFDADRRYRLISQEELARYTRSLSTAVTEAMHHFIGNGSSSPKNESRYLAVTAAHIIHMLRDTLEDASAGYFNIPREFLETHAITLHEVSSRPYRTWVRSRIQLARAYFEAGKGYIAQVQNFRCRIAGWAYIARFEIVSNAIEKDGYCLRPEYSESKNLRAKIKTLWRVFSMALDRNQRLANLNMKQSA